MTKLNKNVVPISYADSGIHPERAFQEKLRRFLAHSHIKETSGSVVHTEFTVFDLLIFPQHSPVRSSKNIIYVSDDLTSEDSADVALYESVSQSHKNRFGNELDTALSNRKMLLSHTTASITNHLVKHGPSEIYTLSKTYRNKTERKEKTQLDIALYDRTLPETLRFAENLFSHMLDRNVTVSLDSNFFYFGEPSFSLVVDYDNQKTYTLGAGGVMREELMSHINKKHGTKTNHMTFIGISYQKLLNLFLNIPPNKYDVDYNDLSSPRFV